ncbi:TRAP transporter large permease [Ammoniphilus resinae]|uniref:C4-dicarboxylate transporter DctM subunit n=1 Tax=Ammoniphilus resinae TaxID=861532 RepID=A0ABS4GIR3_9BACL|nr:TRAP transporter large permease [Ammoniphilus resinae]MBP1930144.1 C4-dicarboxylate transporter DctM subunit [Ammoniphilus resinae]
MATVSIILLLVFLALSVPVAISVGLASIIGIAVDGQIPLLVVIQRIYNTLDSFPLMAIPFFILAGNLMDKGGISQRLVNLANSFVGHMTGGLAMVAVLTSMFFASISGSSAATTAAVGAILIPAMVNRGYDIRFATSVQAASGELGVIIPPSVPMILFGIVTGVSIGDMFIAGIIPGIMIGLTLILLVYVISNRKGYSGGERATWAERFQALRKSFLALLMPFIILGGIYGGIFTPTEAAVIAVVYAFIIGLFVYRDIKVKDLVPIFRDSFLTSAIIMIIIGAAGIFTWVISQEKIPQKLAEFFISITDSSILFLLLVNLMLFIVGMFFETGAAIVILAPILTPIAVALGIDPVHFGIIMIVNLAMGMFTPPLGVNLFVACQVANVRLDQIIRYLIPFIIVVAVDVIIISYIPIISLWFKLFS